MLHNKLSTLQTVQLAVFCVLVFLIPSNLFLKFAEPSAYVHGLLVDYLLPKLYLSDLAVFGLFGWWGVEVFLHRPKYSWPTLHKPLVITAVSLIALGVLQVLSTNPVTSIYFWLKIVEMAIFAGWCATHTWIFRQKIIYAALFVMVCTQVAIGFTQFRLQKSVFPSYLFLGETRLEQRSDIARDTFFNQEKILAYGTTAHPNILAGVLAISLTLFPTYWRSTRKRDSLTLVIILSLFIVIFTYSVSAIIALILGLLIKTIDASTFLLSPRRFKVLAVVVVFIVILAPLLIHIAAKSTDSPSILRRDTLNQGAISIFQKHPLFGSGLGTFTAVLEDSLTPQQLAQNSGARFIQPAHHVGLLVLAETGIFGFLLVAINVITWLKFFKPDHRGVGKLLLMSVPFLPLFVLDHYLWTQQTGQLLFVVGWSWLYFSETT